ncbi:hypothetical protein GCM10017714_00090 [Curtobacterium pusillum]
MAPLEVGVALALPADLLHGVEVAVLGLGLRVQGRDLALQVEQVVRRGAAVLPRHRLEPLRHVGVHEDRTRRVAGLEAGRDPEVPEVPGGLEQGVPAPDRVAAVPLLPERPEAAGDPGIARGQRPEREVRVGGREDRVAVCARLSVASVVVMSPPCDVTSPFSENGFWRRRYDTCRRRARASSCGLRMIGSLRHPERGLL